MRTQITELFGLSVYTDKAIFIGSVDDVVIDVDQKKIDSLAVGELNPENRRDSRLFRMQIPCPHRKEHRGHSIVRHIPGIFRSPAKRSNRKNCPGSSFAVIDPGASHDLPPSG